MILPFWLSVLTIAYKKKQKNGLNKYKTKVYELKNNHKRARSSFLLNYNRRCLISEADWCIHKRWCEIRLQGNAGFIFDAVPTVTSCLILNRVQHRISLADSTNAKLDTFVIRSQAILRFNYISTAILWYWAIVISSALSNDWTEECSCVIAVFTFFHSLW